MSYKVTIEFLINGCCSIILRKRQTIIWFFHGSNLYNKRKYLKRAYCISNKFGCYLSDKGLEIKNLENQKRVVLNKDRETLIKMIFFIINPKKESI